MMKTGLYEGPFDESGRPVQPGKIGDKYAGNIFGVESIRPDVSKKITSKICPTCGQPIGGEMRPGLPKPTLGKPIPNFGLGDRPWGAMEGREWDIKMGKLKALQEAGNQWRPGQRPKLPTPGTTGEYLGYVNGKLQTFPNQQTAQQAGATGIEPNYTRQPTQRSPFLSGGGQPIRTKPIDHPDFRPTPPNRFAKPRPISRWRKQF